MFPNALQKGSRFKGLGPRVQQGIKPRCFGVRIPSQASAGVGGVLHRDPRNRRHLWTLERQKWQTFSKDVGFSGPVFIWSKPDMPGASQ